MDERVESQDTLDVSQVFVGLTRPAMLCGVTLDYLGMSVMVALCGFIIFSSPLFLLLYLPLHLVGAIACAIDPNLFRILFKKLYCFPVVNQKIWGCQSYEPY